MPLLQDVLICALLVLVLSTLVGLPLTRLIVPSRRLDWTLAPALGWAVFSVLTLPALTFTGWSRTHVAVLSGIAMVGGGAALLRKRSSGAEVPPAMPVWACAAAMLVAILPALGIWPKLSSGSLVLADPMFDHSKIAIIDEIVRLGLPPGNPFFGGADAAPGLPYYYLWHFSAALLAALTDTGGWSADIALTWFTAFASLLLIMGLAVRLAGRPLAAPLVLALSLAGSLGPVLRFAFTPHFLGQALSEYKAPEAWIFQATWVPQHLASASCVVLAVLILSRLSWQTVPLLAIVVAAGFESSAWVGGIVFAAGALAIVTVMLLHVDGKHGLIDLLAKVGAAGILTVTVAYPFLHDELAGTAARHLGIPIAFHPYEVLGPLVTDPARRLLDLPAYWCILLVFSLPAIYPAGAVAMLNMLTDRARNPERQLIVTLSLLAVASFWISWLLASTIANNDLGWRAVLPGILVLALFAASGLARWLATARTRAISALICVALGIPDGLAIVMDNAVGRKLPSSEAFAQTPEMWAAVRRYTAPDERVANNPLFFPDTVQYPINVSWALLADRRSCFASWNLVRPFVPLPEAETDRLEALFDRVFAGDGSPQDLDAVATRYNCRTLVLTARDGAWRRDPFADNPHFRLVDEQPNNWRIYRVMDTPREPR
jgi:hypothetical protein